MTVSEVPETRRAQAPEPWGAAAAAFTRWRDGDSAGLEDLVRLLSPVLWQVVRATGLDRDRAEDVVQTTWIALVDHADSITSPQAIAAWLCTSARREAWRAGRQATRERPVDDQVLAHGLPHEESPEHQVILDDEAGSCAECLRQAARALPEAAAHRGRRSRGPTTPRSPARSGCPSAASAPPGAGAWTSCATS